MNLQADVGNDCLSHVLLCLKTMWINYCLQSKDLELHASFCTKLLMRRYKPATARVWLHKWLKQLKQARETAAELTLHKCQREREIKKIVTW